MQTLLVKEIGHTMKCKSLAHVLRLESQPPDKLDDVVLIIITKYKKSLSKYKSKRKAELAIQVRPEAELTA